MAKCVMLKIGGGVTDVTVGRESVVADGVANIPHASATNSGVVGINPEFGISIAGSKLFITKASNSELGQRAAYKGITPKNMDMAIKVALTDKKGDKWTDTERLAALDRMGCTVGDDGVVKFTAQET